MSAAEPLIPGVQHERKFEEARRTNERVLVTQFAGYIYCVVRYCGVRVEAMIRGYGSLHPPENPEYRICCR